MLTRWRSLDGAGRAAVLAAALLAVAGAVAMAVWRHTPTVAYLWSNVLPPSFWTLVGIGLAHWRQMGAHRATHRAAAAAHQIAADTHKHLTGDTHPAAPPERP